MSIQSWLQGLLAPLVKEAVDEAIKDLHDEIVAEMNTLESKLVTELEQLPGKIAGEGFNDVAHALTEITGTTDDIAGKIKTETQPLFQQFFDPVAMANAIIQHLNPFNFGK